MLKQKNKKKTYKENGKWKIIDVYFIHNISVFVFDLGFFFNHYHLPPHSTNNIHFYAVCIYVVCMLFVCCWLCDIEFLMSSTQSSLRKDKLVFIISTH